jgi:hypothetical protein
MGVPMATKNLLKAGNLLGFPAPTQNESPDAT